MFRGPRPLSFIHFRMSRTRRNICLLRAVPNFAPTQVGTCQQHRILRRMHITARDRDRRVTLNQARYSHHTRTGPTASESCGALSTKLAATGFNLFFFARSLIARNPLPGAAFLRPGCCRFGWPHEEGPNAERIGGGTYSGLMCALSQSRITGKRNLPSAMASTMKT